MNRDLPLSQRVARAADSSEAERVLTIHNYLHASTSSWEEFKTIWSTRNDTSWGHGFGRMRGFKSIWMGWIPDYDEDCIKYYRSIAKNYPDVAGLDYRHLYNNSMHTLTNGILEIADDGQSARASYLTPGMLYSYLNDDQQTWGVMLWERYGMDLVKEDGEWKFLHYQVLPEFFAPFDYMNAAAMKYHRVKENIPDPPNPNPRELDDPGPIHCECSPIQPVQNTCPPPLPYKTLNNSNTYTQFDYYED